MSARAAAALAGYSRPDTESWRQRHNPIVRAKMFRIRQLKIDQLAGLALRTLGDLLIDKATPAAVRNNAAQFLLASSGHGPKADKSHEAGVPEDIRAMSMAELERYIAQRFDKTPKVGEGSTIDQESIGPDGPMVEAQVIEIVDRPLATAASVPALPAPPIEDPPADQADDAAGDPADALPPPA